MIPPGYLVYASLARQYPFDLLRGSEARQRVAVERLCLPRRLVPLSILIADDLDGHDDTLGADLVGRGNAVIELTIGLDRELNRTCELVVPQHFEFIRRCSRPILTPEFCFRDTS